MKERPILFSLPMVKAILENRKRQTRRVLKNPEYMGCLTGDCPHETQAECNAAIEHWVKHGFVLDDGCSLPRRPHTTEALPCPYGQPSDRLWVRETFCVRWIDHVTGEPLDGSGQITLGKIGKQQIIYRADYATDEEWEQSCGSRKRRPSIFMPRWASRITLKIAAVRVERVQDISGEDAVAEGVEIPRCGCEVCSHSSQMCPADQSAAIMAYAELWDTINAKREGGKYAWDKNPFVWALEFRRLDA